MVCLRRGLGSISLREAVSFPTEHGALTVFPAPPAYDESA